MRSVSCPRPRNVGRLGVVSGLLLALLAGSARADVEAVRVPNGGFHPRAATDTRGQVHLIFVKGDPLHADLFYVRSDDGCRNFSPPLRVNSEPGSVVVTGTVRGPHLALGRGDRPHIAWMGSDRATPKGPGDSTPMLYTRLNDASDAFEPQRNVIRQKPGLDGGGSVAADREGHVYVAWHAPNAGRDEADRCVWVAHSSDDGKTFEPETRAIADPTGACGCCGMDVVAGESGKVVIAFRSAREGIHRDMHVLTSGDYGGTFKVALIDPWEVGACVMSTASLANASAATLAAWETRGQIAWAQIGMASADASKPSAIPGRGGDRKHPSVAADAAGNAVVAWTEGTGWNKGGALVWQAFDASGKPLSGMSGRAEGVPAWSVPAAVALGERFVIFY